MHPDPKVAYFEDRAKWGTEGYKPSVPFQRVRHLVSHRKGVTLSVTPPLVC